MEPDAAFESEKWLRQQTSALQELFDAASRKLEVSGIRLLTGSAPPKYDDLDSVKRLMLTPLRFLDSSAEESLSLSLSASIRTGPPRYVVALEMSGLATCGALQRLVLNHADLWERSYLRIGLWLTENAETKLLNDLAQITESTASRLGLCGGFLHFDLSPSIQEGLMFVGLLYRCVLDEVSGVDAMTRLYVQLVKSLNRSAPSFRRMVHP